MAVFYDIEKAYDTTWKYGIIHKLYESGFDGELLTFICNFLQDRCIKVQVGSMFSDPHRLYEGVPQGSVLSCTLFALAINDMPTVLPKYTSCTLYVDDFAIYASSASLPTLERRIQVTTSS